MYKELTRKVMQEQSIMINANDDKLCASCCPYLRFCGEKEGKEKYVCVYYQRVLPIREGTVSPRRVHSCWEDFKDAAEEIFYEKDDGNQ